MSDVEGLVRDTSAGPGITNRDIGTHDISSRDVRGTDGDRHDGDRDISSRDDGGREDRTDRSRDYEDRDHRGKRKLSLRHDIRRTVDKLKARDAESQEDEEPRDYQPKSDEQKKRDSVRDSIYKAIDAGKDNAAETGTELIQQTAQGAEPDIDQPPSAWTKDNKAKWSGLDEAIKREVHKREADVERGVNKLKGEIQTLSDRSKAFRETYDEYLGKGTPFEYRHNAIRNLLSYANGMISPNNTPIQKVAHWADAGLRLGVINQQDYHDLDAAVRMVRQQRLAQNGGYQPQPNGYQQPNGQQLQPYQQQQLQAYQQQNPQNQLVTYGELERQQKRQREEYQQIVLNSEVQGHVNQWSRNKSYYRDVQDTMVALMRRDIERGQSITDHRQIDAYVDNLYDRATYSVPEIRTLLLEDQRKKEATERQEKQRKAEEAQKKKLADARRASSSLASSSPDGEVRRGSGPQKGLTVRESLKEAIDQISSR